MSTDTPTTTDGRVVWHDLMTTDPDKARAFYSELFGWNTAEMDMGTFKYQMIQTGEKQIGGYIPLEQKEVPSHWIAYVNVDDVDEACKTADASGGKTCVPATDIPNVGRFAVITDPSGGVISPFKSAHEAPADADTGKTEPGEFCWDELLTQDPEGCRGFYTNVFGWKGADMEMPEGTYTIFKHGDKDRTGMMKMPGEVQAHSHWLPYVHVADVDASFERAKTLGATACKEPGDIPNIGRFAVLTDPTGAQFALYTPAPQQG